MRRVSTVVLAGACVGLVLAGCERPASAPLLQDAAAVASALETKAKPGTGSPAQPPAASAPMLAYDYSYDLRLPSQSVRPTLARHEQACVSAGPATCQVIAANLDAGGDDAGGTLKLRATAAWIGRFRAGLDADVKGPGGGIQQSGVQTEDLTRSIVDGGAAIRAKTLLRDRLEKLLAERPGKLSDLLDLEKNIADVQGEIDAAQSELAVMQARVDMSGLTLSYASSQPAIGGRTFQPLANAAHGFAGNVLAVLAALVTISSFLLPLALVVGLGWIVWRRIRRRRVQSPVPQN